MSNTELEKEKIRRKYQGVPPDRIRVIPAKEETDLFNDSREKRVAVYVRVSTNDPRQTSSFELQQGHYADVIRQHPGWTLYRIYADEGISGTSLKHRDAFLEMIRDCEEGHIDLILTKSVSRFSRNVYDCIGYVRKLASLKHPVGVYFETEHIYTLKPGSEAGMDFIAVLAQEESRAKSNSMNLSYEMRFRRGIVLTPELLGYDLNENRELVINDEEALTVRLIFFLYLYGCTCQQIAETLMSLKRRTKRGRFQWSAGSVLNILQNERYCGDVLARKTWTPNYLDHKSKKNIQNRNQYLCADHHEAIILRDDFIAVQRLIANAKHRYRGILPALRVYTLLIEMLIDPIRRLFVVRPASKECRNAVSWLRHDGNSYHSKRIVGTAFLRTFFQILEWDPRCKYRVRGICKQQGDEMALLFDLHDTEVTLPAEKPGSADTPYEILEDMHPLTATAQKNVIAYPVDWFEEFGLEYYRHAQMQELLSMGSGTAWTLQAPGIPALYAEGLEPTPSDELERELQRLLGNMREGADDVGSEP